MSSVASAAAACDRVVPELSLPVVHRGHDPARLPVVLPRALSTRLPRRRARQLGLWAGIAADVLFGDPQRWHPVAGFGHVALAVERWLWQPNRRAGLWYVGLLILGPALLGRTASRLLAPVGEGRFEIAEAALTAATTWAAVGARSLHHHGLHLADLLEHDDLNGARTLLPTLAGRDPSGLDERELCRAAIESIAENTADAVTGVLFWGALCGPAGVMAYRAANTLDAMVGHHNARYEQFGWAAARLDDVLTWPAARVGALLAVILASTVHGSPLEAWTTWRRDGHRHPSPNAGQLEAAFAGALGIELGGANRYGTRLEHRPILGRGRAPRPEDLRRAVFLSQAVTIVATAVCAL